MWTRCLVGLLILLSFIFVHSVYAGEPVERWLLIAEGMTVGKVYVEVSTYSPDTGAWYRLVDKEKTNIIRIIEQPQNRAICFTGIVEGDKIYNLPGTECAITQPETISDTIFMSLIVMRNEYSKRHKQ